MKLYCTSKCAQLRCPLLQSSHFQSRSCRICCLKSNMNICNNGFVSVDQNLRYWPNFLVTDHSDQSLHITQKSYSVRDYLDWWTNLPTHFQSVYNNNIYRASYTSLLIKPISIHVLVTLYLTLPWESPTVSKFSSLPESSFPAQGRGKTFLLHTRWHHQDICHLPSSSRPLQILWSLQPKGSCILRGAYHHNKC